MNSRLAALGAIALWSSLASLISLIPEVPVLLATGVGLLIGSTVSLPLAKFRIQQLKVRPRVIVLGVYGLFGYHAALFLALQTSPQVQANLLNYLWPLLIVVLAPLFTKGQKLGVRVLIAAILGFAGATLAIAGGVSFEINFYPGYLFALLAAVIWATYSLGTGKIEKFPTPAVGVFAFVAGLLAIILHLILESPYALSYFEWTILLLLGIGPLGTAFYFWDWALKNGDAQQIGLLSFLTPLLSTSLLLAITGQPLTWSLAVAAALIVGAAALGRTNS